MDVFELLGGEVSDISSFGDESSNDEEVQPSGNLDAGGLIIAPSSARARVVDDDTESSDDAESDDASSASGGSLSAPSVLDVWREAASVVAEELRYNASTAAEGQTLEEALEHLRRLCVRQSGAVRFWQWNV